ncbi:hypothetical protein QE152_g38583 [Popillia japonica]|uniref:Uncharacterized protein n=1 Tax=Popillia japonica TaxID=7064 RepID=A0AAW1HXJ4_POPJA
MGLQYSKVFQRCTNHLYKLAPIFARNVQIREVATIKLYQEQKFARNVQIREVATIKLYQEQKYASYCIWCNRKSKNRKSISKHEQMVAHWRVRLTAAELQELADNLNLDESDVDDNILCDTEEDEDDCGVNEQGLGTYHNQILGTESEDDQANESSDDDLPLINLLPSGKKNT